MTTKTIQSEACQHCKGQRHVTYFRGPGATDPNWKDCPECNGTGRTSQVVARPLQIACGALPDPSGLLAAIILHPDEDTPRLMYADWLDEHDQPDRAEYIRVSLKLIELNATPHVSLQEMESVIKRHGKLVEWYVNSFASGSSGILGCDTFRGFVIAIHCSWEAWVKHGDELRAREWVPLVKLTTRPGYHRNIGTAGFDVWIIPAELTGVTHGEAVSLEERDEKIILYASERYHGTKFELPA